MNILVVIFDSGSQFRNTFASSNTFAFSNTVPTTLQLAGLVTTPGALLSVLLRIMLVAKSAPRTLVGMGNHVMMIVVEVEQVVEATAMVIPVVMRQQRTIVIVVIRVPRQTAIASVVVTEIVVAVTGTYEHMFKNVSQIQYDRW
jgi:hypothetical protein